MALLLAVELLNRALKRHRSEITEPTETAATLGDTGVAVSETGDETTETADETRPPVRPPPR